MGNHLQLINFSKEFIIVSKDKVINSDRYKEIEIGQFKLFFTKDFNINEVKNEKFHVVVLGTLFDSRNSKKKIDEIVNDLLIFEIDSIQFLEEMSYYNGRYILLVNNGKDVYFYNDATSFMSMYYHKTYPIYCSHSAQLHKLLISLYQCEEIQQYDKSKGFLDTSKYQNIFKFNSNTRIMLNNGQIERIFPLSNFKSKSVEEVYENTINLIENSADYITSLDKKIMVSLTAGFDSRLSLALMKNYIKDILFFTYVKNDRPDSYSLNQKLFNIDKKNVMFIVDQLNLEHDMFNIDTKRSAPFVDELYGEYESKHSIQLIKYYDQNKIYHNNIHIKSTIFELVKGIRPKILEHCPEIHEDYLTVLKKWSNIADDNWILKEFDRFIECNQIKKFVNKGYHLYDILYLESRMNGWHSAIIQESDPYFEVFNLINCRYILFNFMELDYKERKALAFHNYLIEKKWPLLTFFGVNDSSTLLTKLDELDKQIEQLKVQKQGIEIPQKTQLEFKTTNFNQFKTENGIIFVRNQQILEKDKRYNLSIYNQTMSNYRIEIKTYYTNPKGKDRLYIGINNQYADVVNISKQPLSIELKEGQNLNIELLITKTTDRLSWIKAGKFEVIIHK